MDRYSSIIRILLHSLFLISLNLFSTILALLVSHLFAVEFDHFWQSFLTYIINLSLYIIIYRIMKSIQEEVMKIDDRSMLVIILLASLAFMPFVYFPLNFMIKGYWVELQQIYAIWPYQFAVNAVCLIMNFFVLTKKK